MLGEKRFNLLQKHIGALSFYDKTVYATENLIWHLIR